MNVDLLRRVPLDAVGDAPCALPGEERGELHAQPRVDRAALREPVVVVRLGEMDERAVSLGAFDRAGQVALELAAVVGLENLRIRPVEVRLGEQAVGDGEFAAQALQQKHGVGILLAHLRDDVAPRLGGNHVPRVAAEAVHAVPAPEEEDVGHVRAQLRVRVVELDEIRPLDAPGARRMEAAVRLVPEPVRVVRLQGRGPARVVRGQVDEEEPAPRMDGANQLLELAERRDGLVELGHRGIDREEVRRGERTAVFAHDGIRRRHGERRQRLDDAEAHRVHDERQTPHDFAEAAELAREDAVDRVVRARLAALDLDVQVAPLGPFGHVRTFGEEAGLAGEDADLVQGNLGREDAGRGLGERNVRPRLREGRHALLRLVDDLAAAHGGVAKVRAERGAAFARRIDGERDGERVAAPHEQKGFRSGCLGHESSGFGNETEETRAARHAGITCQRRQKKWQIVPASTKRCQTMCA